MTYLITGAAGFVGACLVRRILEEKDGQVHLLLKPTTKTWRLDDVLKSPRVVVHNADLVAGPELPALMQKIQPDVIYHLAARGAYSDQDDPIDIFETNLLGTLHLLRALEDVKYQLFVQTGSSSEYGFQDEPMSEATTVPEPNSFYAVSKLAATHLAAYMSQRSDKPIVTVRLFSVYGPWEAPGRLMPVLMQKIWKAEAMQFANPKIARDFIYVDDVTQLLLDETSLQKVVGGYVNLGTGVQTSLEQLVPIASAATGKTFKAEWGSMPARRWDQTTWVADISRLQNVVQWSPSFSLEEGLQQMWQWYQDNHHYYS